MELVTTCAKLHSLELCLARYLSLHFFFFPNGLQDCLPCLPLLLLATLLQRKTHTDRAGNLWNVAARVRHAAGFCFRLRWRMANVNLLPLLEFWRGYQSGEVDGAALHSALPPVWVLLVDDVDDVARLELQTGLFARNEVVRGRVVVELSPHVHLQITQQILQG